MKRFAVASLFVLVALLLPAVSDAQKKDKQPDVPMASPEEYAALNNIKDVNGTITAIELNSLPRTVTFRVEYQEYAANPKYKPSKTPGNPNATQNYQNSFNKIMADQQRAMSIQNPNQRQQALNRVQNDYQNLMNKMYNDMMNQSAQAQAQYQKDVQNNNFPYILVTKQKDVQLEVQDKVVVRRKKMPNEYDDKGFVKEYTKEELDKLHLVDNKDKTKPGFPAKFEDLGVKMKVTLYLTPFKKETPKKGDKADKDKAEKKDPQAPLDPMAKPNQPTIRLIYITDDNGAIPLGEIPTSPTPDKKKKN